jgi:L-alanine-DL-glutamate epimerase-like enolase superfamily enzyme
MTAHIPNTGPKTVSRTDSHSEFNRFLTPFPQLVANRLPGYQRLRQQKALPILMDEAIVSLADLEAFHQLGLLDGVAMKVSRCGGLTEARRIVEYMEQHGLLFFASGLTDPDVSLAASLLLFSAYGLEHPAALNGPQFLTGTVLRSPLRIEGDQAFAPSGPGLGVEVDDTASLITGPLVLNQAETNPRHTRSMPTNPKEFL